MSDTTATQGEQTTTFVMGDKLYDRLKLISLVILPAIATVYAGLAIYWGLPKSVEVVASITLIDTAVGGLLKVSTKSYQALPSPEPDVVTEYADPDPDGTIDVSTAPDGKKTFSLGFDSDDVIDQLDQKDYITFKVNAVAPAATTPATDTTPAS